MAYVVIDDFKVGLDKRRLAASSVSGSLQKLTNGHINRGGEIEKRMAWVSKYDLPAGKTRGWAGANGRFYTFGSEAGVVVPVTTTYQRLIAPGNPAITRINDVEFFDGKVAVSADFADATSHVFYDGTIIADFETGSGAAVAGKRAASLLTFDDKLHAVVENVLAFSSINAPTLWNSGTGYGFINISNHSAGAETLTGLAIYQAYVAVFARRNIQTWFMDPDPLQNDKRQVLSNIGTFAPKSIVSVGADVFFLADTGVRSLRARDASNQANVQDVGTLVDSELVKYLKSIDPAVAAKAVGVVEPVDGRYILAIGNKAYVFSYYPSSKISAWSNYDNGFTVEDFVAMDGQLYARSGDKVYLYGGDSGASYDTTQIEIDLPYVDGHQVATWKSFTGVDFICEGAWSIYVNTDPNNPTAESLVGTINGTTLNGMDIGVLGESPIFKLRLVNSLAVPATMSKIVVHYESEDAH